MPTQQRNQEELRPTTILLPVGETLQSLELERTFLRTEVKKRHNGKIIREKMAKTFGYKRQEIVDKQPSIQDLMDRWPAPFHDEEINTEFHRITTRSSTIPLQTRFMAQLDKHSSQLLEIRSKGGATREKTTKILQILDQDTDNILKRECIVKSRIIYLGESVEHLIKEYMISQQGEAENDLQQAIMAVFVIREDEHRLHLPKGIGIVIAGVEVLNELPSVAAAFVCRALWANLCT